MGGFSDDNIWVMDRYTFEYWQHSSRQWQGSGKSGILLQIEKAPKTINGDLTCYVFSLEDVVAHLNVTDSSGILTIEKWNIFMLGTF